MRTYKTGWHQSAYQKECARIANTGKTVSAHTRKLISKANKGKRTGKDNPFYGKSHPLWLRKQIGSKIRGRVSTFLGRKHSKKTKKVMSLLMSVRLQKGFFPYKKCLYEHSRRNIAIWMRSSWEVAFAEYLEDFELTWVYEPKSFVLSIGGYTPDFYVKEWNCYVEIKGAEWLSAMRKIEVFSKETKHVLKVLKQDDLINLGVLI